MDHIQKFINSLQAAGIPPANNSEIIADDKKNRYSILGDKPKAKNGVYQLKIDGDFAVGWAMSYKDNELHKFSSKSSTKWTPDERAAFAKKVDAEKRKKEKERKELAEKIAVRAGAIWKAAEKTGSNKYLERKKCDLNGARFHKGLLVVPAYREGKIVTLQFIAESGEKRFMKDGDLQGGYFPIAKKDDPKNVYLLCEGFSTGDSIRKATGLPVIVCFNAGNLLPVAEYLQKKYPESRLVFCADNDEFTVINNEYVNVGIKKAQQAAVKCGGAHVIFPQFPDNTEEKKLSDFNDAFLALGAEYVKNRIESAVNSKERAETIVDGKEAASSVVERQNDDFLPSTVHVKESNMPIAPNDEWRDQLTYDDKGNFAKNNLRNVTLFLLNDPNLKEAFVLDEFHNQVVCQKDITGGKENFKVHPVGDDDIMELCIYFERMGLLKDDRKIGQLMNYVAGINRINPAIDYFETLVWDKVERLGYWLKEAFDAPEPKNYLADIGTKWLVAAVKRVYEPGCKFDHMLMLEGSQGAGKSSALKLLAAFGEKVEDPYKNEPKKSYYTDALTFDAIGDKDCMMMTSGSIIVVLEELVGKGKKSDDDIKRWITLGADKGRLPYAKFVTDSPRQFVLAGTTNNYDYLRDPTGNRRYWALTVRNVDKKYINDHREQMWAEAVYHYKNGMYLALEGETLKLAEFEQKKRLEEDVWESAVVEALPAICFKPFGTSDLMKEMNLPLRDQDARSMGRVKNILKKLGYENKPTREGETVKRMWIKEND